ncbi:NAD dependent epimerase/dehydratase family protein [Annulohypoxylon truncatum]|uniref:NAD dependent epimerase/dehydratase family protein n=1 Tax=Annulohypoxylon truncatum TaxID=327061 RepID=UPI00200888BB|nr:NAD dependent epimerase/dehydratase family protein [Annulohypoxylon truncatum]KAI1209545.1 NAD dependent epimerase/dehydratase family protein [Annulohypoxylon truncatum]
MASASTSPKILLTGVTGYIGGTILNYLLDSSSAATSIDTVSCLLRGPDRAAKLASTYGSRVNPIVYKDFDDIEATVAAAAEHDIVISTTHGWHAASSQALIRGLAQRKAATGRDVWFIHTSGTSNVAYKTMAKGYTEQGRHDLDDAKDDIYAYEKEREQKEGPYGQRTMELAVVDTGLELGVKTLVIMSPTIYGLGSGLWNKLSIQLPMLASAVLKNKRPAVLGEGKGVWDHVHVDDLAELYVLVVRRIIENGGEGVPTGKKGIIFSSNGRFSWLDVTRGMADVLHEKGLLADREVQSVGVSDMKKILGLEGATDDIAQLSYFSDSRTLSSVARSLGWNPTRGEEAWKREIQDVVEAVLAKGA